MAHGLLAHHGHLVSLPALLLPVGGAPPPPPPSDRHKLNELVEYTGGPLQIDVFMRYTGCDRLYSSMGFTLTLSTKEKLTSEP